jgi:hypothetical protein
VSDIRRAGDSSPHSPTILHSIISATYDSSKWRFASCFFGIFGSRGFKAALAKRALDTAASVRGEPADRASPRIPPDPSLSALRDGSGRAGG